MRATDTLLRTRRHPCGRICRGESGQGMAEYLIIVIVVAVAVIVAVRYFGGSVGESFKSATNQIRSPATAQAPGKAGPDEAGVRRQDSAPPSAYESESEKAASERSGGGSADSGPGSAKSRQDLTELASSLSVGVGDSGEVNIAQLKLSFSTLFFIALAICAGGLFIVTRMRKKTGKGRRKKKKGSLSAGASDQAGQAMVEFLLCAVSFLFCILGVLQLALCLNAFTLVRYAAYNAARAGIVHGADLDEMREAARISLLPVYPRHGRADHVLGVTDNYVGAKATDQLSVFTFDSRPITEVSLVDNAGLAAGDVVTFDDPAFGRSSLITVQVVHQYELIIPLVNRIAYYLYRRKKTGGGDYRGESVDSLAATTDKLRKGGDLDDIEYRIPIVAHYTMRLQSDYEAQ